MNFFQAQDRARRNTWWLVLLFIAAVAATVAIIYTALHYGLAVAQRGDAPAAVPAFAIDNELLLNTALGVLALVSIGSIYKALALSGGGGKVAESMGGRLLLHATRDADERRLLNIVEEMAIAAGAPMPDVYLLPDDNINAFAAGTTPSNAAIGVTRGALRQLSREQMQGVIAHEFSHIMNGDMRLNIRLIAIINGIMLLGYLGYFILRSSLYSSMGRSRSNGQNALPLIGIALVVAGFIGTFFGSWIRAAVSRQREYLADAAAVQYTRQPRGIAGALERIGQHAGMIKTAAADKSDAAPNPRAPGGAGAQMDAPADEIGNAHAIEYSHLFFSNAVSIGFSNPFATHPPLAKRISRLVPNWSEEAPINTTAAPPLAAEAPPPTSAKAATSYSSLFGGSAAAGFAAAAVVGQIGTLNAASIERAGAVVQKIPPALARASQDPYSARALVYTMLLDKKHQDIRASQLAHLQQNADDGVYEMTVKLLPEVNMLPPPAILPLVQSALPTLRLLSPQQYELFLANMAALIAADKAIELFEWCIQAIVVHSLHDYFSKERRAFGGGDKNAAMAYALSILVRVGQKQPEAAFASAVKQAKLALTYSQRGFNPQELFASLQILAGLPPKKKERFATAAALGAAYDNRIDPDEAALLRAYFMIMDCPLPLLAAEEG